MVDELVEVVRSVERRERLALHVFDENVFRGDGGYNRSTRHVAVNATIREHSRNRSDDRKKRDSEAEHRDHLEAWGAYSE